MTDGARRFEGQRWSLAVFSAREDPSRLMDCVRAAAEADCAGASLVIDLLVNGNRALALEMRDRLAALAEWTSGISIRLWSIAQADKAHAWNHYLAALVPAGELAFFMDGYVKIDPEALSRMAGALCERPHALGATSIPSTGRSAAVVRRRFLLEGGLHGNLYAMTGSAVARMRRAGFRLPTNIYRNDSALGAALAFNLDPARYRFDWDRIAVVPDAGYETPAASPVRLSDLSTMIRRRLRQAQGTLETLALKAHLAEDRRSPAEWPATVRELILQWSSRRPADARGLFWTDPLAWIALQRMRMRPEGESSPGGAERLGVYSGRFSVPARRPPDSER